MSYYMAYGSNLNIEQMARRCPDAVAVGTALLLDYELVFRRGYLTIEPKKGSVVDVGVWQIYAEDEAALDRYEGYPRFYRKEFMDIRPSFLEANASISCMVYTMNDGYPVQPPSDGYLTTVRIGYKNFGFDTAPLMRAYENAKWPDD